MVTTVSRLLPVVFVAMPSRKENEGIFRDVVHPITREAREKLEKTVLEHYYEAVHQNNLTKSSKSIII